MLNDDDKFSVGYGKPPPQNRFQKGQSGNPKGRPRGSRNLSTIMERALNERVTIKENGRPRRITKREAAVKQLANKSASGDLKSIQVLLNFLVPREKSTDASDAQPESFDAVDAEVMKGILGRFSSQKNNGGGEEEDGGQSNGSDS
jgi:hypothetical protein